MPLFPPCMQDNVDQMTATEMITEANTRANAAAAELMVPLPPAAAASSFASMGPPRTGTKMAALPAGSMAPQLPVQLVTRPPAASPAAPGRTPVRPVLKLGGSLPFGTPLLQPQFGDAAMRRAMPTPVARAIKARRVSFGANQVKSIPARGDIAMAAEHASPDAAMLSAKPTAPAAVLEHGVSGASSQVSASPAPSSSPSTPVLMAVEACEPVAPAATLNVAGPLEPSQPQMMDDAAENGHFGGSASHRAALSAMLLDMHAAVVQRTLCEQDASSSEAAAAEIDQHDAEVPPVAVEAPPEADAGESSGLVRHYTRFDELSGAVIAHQSTAVASAAVEDAPAVVGTRTHTKFDDETGAPESVTVVPIAPPAAAACLEDEMLETAGDVQADDEEEAEDEDWDTEEGEVEAGDDVSTGVICGKHIFFLSPEGVPLPTSSASSAAASDPHWDAVYGISADADTDCDEEGPVQALFVRTSAPTPLRQQIRARGVMAEIRKRPRTSEAGVVAAATSVSTVPVAMTVERPSVVEQAQKQAAPDAAPAPEPESALRKGLPTPLRQSIKARKVQAEIKARGAAAAAAVAVAPAAAAAVADVAAPAPVIAEPATMQDEPEQAAAALAAPDAAAAPRKGLPTPLRQSIKARKVQAEIKARGAAAAAAAVAVAPAAAAAVADVAAPTPVVAEPVTMQDEPVMEAMAVFEASEPEVTADDVAPGVEDVCDVSAANADLPRPGERSPYLKQWAEGDADPKYRRGRESVLYGPSDSPDRRLSTVYEQVGGGREEDWLTHTKASFIAQDNDEEEERKAIILASGGAEGSKPALARAAANAARRASIAAAANAMAAEADTAAPVTAAMVAPAARGRRRQTVSPNRIAAVAAATAEEASTADAAPVSATGRRRRTSGSKSLSVAVDAPAADSAAGATAPPTDGVEKPHAAPGGGKVAKKARMSKPAAAAPDASALTAESCSDAAEPQLPSAASEAASVLPYAAPTTAVVPRKGRARKSAGETAVAVVVGAVSVTAERELPPTASEAASVEPATAPATGVVPRKGRARKSAGETAAAAVVDVAAVEAVSVVAVAAPASAGKRKRESAAAALSASEVTAAAPQAPPAPTAAPAPPPSVAAAADYDALKVADLRALLSARSLSAIGVKAALIARLKEADAAAGALPVAPAPAAPEVVAVAPADETSRKKGGRKTPALAAAPTPLPSLHDEAVAAAASPALAPPEAACASAPVRRGGRGSSGAKEAAAAPIAGAGAEAEEAAAAAQLPVKKSRRSAAPIAAAEVEEPVESAPAAARSRRGAAAAAPAAAEPSETRASRRRAASRK